MRGQLLLVFIFSVNALYGQKSIKVVVERFENGQPKLVRYFYSPKDTSERIEVDTRIGFRGLNKPITLTTETYFNNGQLEYRGKYVKGLANGIFEFYYDNGNQLARSYYKNGKPCDSLICYYPSGKLKRVVIEKDKSKNYWFNIDYYENGAKALECYQFQQVNKIVLTGKYIEWYDNGQKAFEGLLKNNWTVGKWTQWDETGVRNQSSEQFRIASIGEN